MKEREESERDTKGQWGSCPNRDEGCVHRLVQQIENAFVNGWMDTPEEMLEMSAWCGRDTVARAFAIVRQHGTELHVGDRTCGGFVRMAMRGVARRRKKLNRDSALDQAIAIRTVEEAVAETGQPSMELKGQWLLLPTDELKDDDRNSKRKR